MDGEPTLVLDDSAVYWFLYRYFESANLPPREHELIDLYSDAEISGYQLQRFIDEMRVAETDAENRPEAWSVLLGWNEHGMAKAHERRKLLPRDEALAMVRQLLSLAEAAQARGQALISIGD